MRESVLLRIALALLVLPEIIEISGSFGTYGVVVKEGEPIP